MDPVSVLAAARGNVVGPYVPARVEWFTDWQGPARDGEWNVNVVVLESFGPTCLVYGTDPTGQDAEWELRVSRIRIDLRRPEVRDHLVRCGAPAWARDIPVALWVWATMGSVLAAEIMPTLTNSACCVFSLGGRVAWWTCTTTDRDYFIDPVSDGHLGWAACGESGQETGEEARLCIILAALRAGCVLEEADGWLVPLPGGGVGFWPKS